MSRIHMFAVGLWVVASAASSAATTAAAPVGLVGEVVWVEGKRRVWTSEWEGKRRRCGVGVVYAGAGLARRVGGVKGMEDVPWVVIVRCHVVLLFEEYG
ncbi:hypothetical protein ACQKWADRAFT_287911 [Trichoderma austrokoningii]